MSNNAIPETKPLPAEVIPFPIAPSLAADLDEFANHLEMVPDDIMLAYITTRYTQKQILSAYKS